MSTHHPSHLTAALIVTIEFGPQRARSRGERLAERHPEIPRKLHDDLLSTCDEIETEAFRLGERMRDEQFAAGEAARLLTRAYPMLPADLVERVVSQGAYFARK